MHRQKVKSHQSQRLDASAPHEKEDAADKNARQNDAALSSCSEPGAFPHSPGQVGSEKEGDEELHLPIWISSTEKAQIEQHLQEWAESLLKVRSARFVPSLPPITPTGSC